MAKYTQDQIDLMRRTRLTPSRATDDEFAMFIYQVERTGLDPFTRQIYAVGRWDKDKQREVLAVQTSIDGFRLIAERTGKYAGQLGPEWCGADGVWRDVWTERANPAAARVAALRHDFSEPCWGVARFSSYAIGQSKKLLEFREGAVDRFLPPNRMPKLRLRMGGRPSRRSRHWLLRRSAFRGMAELLWPLLSASDDALEVPPPEQRVKRAAGAAGAAGAVSDLPPPSPHRRRTDLQVPARDRHREDPFESKPAGNGRLPSGVALLTRSCCGRTL